MRPKLLLFALAVSLLCAPGPVAAQSSEETLGRSAEQAGLMREAVTHYIAALGSAVDGTPGEQWLREKIITLVRHLEPPLAVPDEAIRFEVRGRLAVADAQTPAELIEACKEYAKAVRLAPWWAEGYSNLAAVQEKAGQLIEASRSLKFYAMAAPEAADAAKAKEHSYELEYRYEKAQKELIAKREAEERVLQEQQRREAEAREAEARRQRAIEQVTSNLSGTWIAESSYRFRYLASLQEHEIELVWTDVDWGSGWRKAQATTRFRGTIQELQITGQYEIENAKGVSSRGDGTFSRGTFSGRIDPDGHRIAIEYVLKGQTTSVILKR